MSTTRTSAGSGTLGRSSRLGSLFNRSKSKASNTQTPVKPPKPNRRQSVRVPLQQRLQQCMATEQLYETQLQQYRDLDALGEQLCIQESDIAETLQKYVDTSLPRNSSNPQIMDLIDISDQLTRNLLSLAQLRMKLNAGITHEAVRRLDELILASRPPEDVTLNDNQLELETEYVLNLRNVGLTRSLTAMARHYINYFEQGAQLMRTMKIVTESIESRQVDVLPTRPEQSTIIFGRPLRKVMGRHSENGPIPAQIEHCLRFVEQHAYKDAGVYRVPGQHSEIERIKALLDDGEFPDFENMEISNKNHTICGVIKLYIRELPEPLLTFEKFDDFIDAARNSDPQQQFEQIQALMKTLPDVNLHLLRRLIHTFRLVIENEEFNKMNANSIAISFGMNLMRMKVEDGMKLMACAQYINKLCEILIADRRFFDDTQTQADETSETENSIGTPRTLGGSVPDNGITTSSVENKLESPIRKSATLNNITV
jgi:hypothetical protein